MGSIVNMACCRAAKEPEYKIVQADFNAAAAPGPAPVPAHRPSPAPPGPHQWQAGNQDQWRDQVRQNDGMRAYQEEEARRMAALRNRGSQLHLTPSHQPPMQQQRPAPAPYRAPAPMPSPAPRAAPFEEYVYGADRSRPYQPMSAMSQQYYSDGAQQGRLSNGYMMSPRSRARYAGVQRESQVHAQPQYGHQHGQLQHPVNAPPQPGHLVNQIINNDVQYR